MTRRLSMQWNLRQVMAGREIYQTSELVPLLAERGVSLSREHVYRLVAKTPQRLNMEVLAALRDILDCQPNDLLQPVVETAKVAKTGTEPAGPGIGDLRPIRAKLTARTRERDRWGAQAADPVCPLCSGEAVLPASPGQAGMRDLPASVRTHRHDLPGMRRNQGVGVL